MRPSRRQPDELRSISLERGVVKYAEGSCFVKFGDTHVLVTATLEDLVAAEPRPNMPGTTDEWPNWSIPLPVAIDDLDAEPLVGPVIDALAKGRAGSA